MVAHLNELRRLGLLPPGVAPDTPSQMDEALKRAGRAHEERVLRSLEGPIVSIPFGAPDRYERTLEALRARVPVVHQAALAAGDFAGYADLLLLDAQNPFLSPAARRAAHPGTYAVCEVKLASTNRTDFVLQVAAYSSMLSELLAKDGVPPSPRAYLWLGSPNEPPTRLAVNSLNYLFNRTRRDYDEFLTGFSPTAPIPASDGPMSNLAPWQSYAERVLEEEDSLQLIAGIRRSQAQAISNRFGIESLTGFAALPLQRIDACTTESEGALASSMRRLHRQARMQLATRMNGGSPTSFELLPDISPSAPRGLHRLPPLSPGDAYFDMEGFPLMDDGGLEYLLGASDGADGPFVAWWAHDREQEEVAFTSFVSWLSSRRRVNPELHVYHYGHYEVSAMRRVGVRASTADGIGAALELANMAEDGVFVDIYEIIKASLCIGEPSYSIKNVEKLVGVSRAGDTLADAESSVAMYYEWMRSVDKDKAASVDAEDDPILSEILNYNRQDCESLQKVVHWLRQVASANGIDFTPVPQSAARGDLQPGDGDAIENEALMPGSCGRSTEDKACDSATIERSQALSLQVMGSVDLDKKLRLVLAHLLHFYVRESAPARHRFVSRISRAADGDFDTLFVDDQCLAAVRFIEKVSPAKNSRQRGPLLKYSYDVNQPLNLKYGTSVAFVVPISQSKDEGDVDSNDADLVTAFMTVKSVTQENGIALLSTKNADGFCPPPSGSLVSCGELVICPSHMRASILRTVGHIASGNPVAMEYALAHSFLLREDAVSEGKLAPQPELTKNNIGDFLAAVQEPHALVIQGPPGSGKTVLSARLICDLILKHNKTVVVSSNSHEAIDNLLRRTISLGIDPTAVCKVGPRNESLGQARSKSNLCDVDIAPYSLFKQSRKGQEHEDPAIETQPKRRSRGKILPACLVGATPYALSRVEAIGLFDYMFVDEASQVPMANFVAMAPSSRYAVLVGDQQQLEMPIQGAHTGAVGLSCLAYLVGDGVNTVLPTQGLFLDISYRMQPTLCNFVSRAFYENALAAHDISKDNCINLKQRASGLIHSGKGLVFVPCDLHENNDPACATQGSKFGKRHKPAEVDVISKLISELIGCSYSANGVTKVLEHNDILVVAPYNAQVAALRETLNSDVRIGTVDKFQGQEAPVVLVSACAAHDENLNTETGGPRSPDLESEGTSSTTAIPDSRGLRFALRRNRLNVAISRAQCLAVVTGCSDACARAPILNLDDLDAFAIYEQIVVEGSEQARIASDKELFVGDEAVRV